MSEKKYTCKMCNRFIAINKRSFFCKLRGKIYREYSVCDYYSEALFSPKLKTKEELQHIVEICNNGINETESERDGINNSVRDEKIMVLQDNKRRAEEAIKAMNQIEKNEKARKKYLLKKLKQLEDFEKGETK